MIKFTGERLEEISKRASKKKIIVFGDLMVDEYLWGSVTRISPEAPVPIINISSEQVRFGGSANVAYNLLGLQATPVLIGVVGNDRMGNVFQDMLAENRLPANGIVSDTGRPTTVKTRIIGNNQHIARVDQESTEAISHQVEEKIYQLFVSHIEESDAVIIQDYNKGVVRPHLVSRITDLAQRHGKHVTVDPKFENFFSFTNTTLFKPNIKETEEALAVRLNTDEDVINAGKELLKRLQCKNVLITRGSKGMALFKDNGTYSFLETRARKVADVSGAGDTVIATLTYALSGGACIEEAVMLANFAAGLVCEEVGVVPVQLHKLLSWVLKQQDNFND